MNTRQSSNQRHPGLSFFLDLYMTGASVGRNGPYLQMQHCSEVHEIMDRYHIIGSPFRAEAKNEVALFKVEIRSTGDNWDDCEKGGVRPRRFASRWQAEREIDRHLKNLRESGKNGSRKDFRIVPDAAWKSIHIEIPFVADHLSLTMRLAEELSYDRSPPNAEIGHVNIIRDMMDKYPNLDPSIIHNLVDVFADQEQDPDLTGSAIISIATIILDGNSTKLDIAINDLESNRINTANIRGKASHLRDVVKTITEAMSPKEMVEAIQKPHEMPMPRPAEKTPALQPSSPAP